MRVEIVGSPVKLWWVSVPVGIGGTEKVKVGFGIEAVGTEKVGIPVKLE